MKVSGKLHAWYMKHAQTCMFFEWFWDVFHTCHMHVAAYACNMHAFASHMYINVICMLHAGYICS